MSMTDNRESERGLWSNLEFRPDFAFATFAEEMVARMGSYGREETVPPNTVLFTHDERQVDMFVVLDGEIEISLPIAKGETKVIAVHRRYEFSGELNLLTSQGSLVVARSVKESRLLRISRADLQRLMRAEGDIANLITSSNYLAANWYRWRRDRRHCADGAVR